MGSHKPKENGYKQMEARLYNTETGRFMSVRRELLIFELLRSFRSIL
jgi:hypothetical protein